MKKLLDPRLMASVPALLLAAHGTALAEPTLDQLLATVSVSGAASCAHVEVKLNRPVNITDVVPAEKGLDVSLHIEPLATTMPTQGVGTKEAASVPQPWAPVVAFDHTAAVGTCFSCHDGAHKTSVQTITGKDGAHLNTTNTCESCHVTGTVYANWKVTPVTKFDHSQAIGTCGTCHDGTHKMGISGTIVDSKTSIISNHFITTQDCSSCHTTTNWTTILNYTHLSATYVAHTSATGVTGCASCHKQNNEKITFAQPSLVPNCAACHSTSFKAGSHVKYSTPSTVYYTFTELKDCTGACHTYTDQTLSKIKTTRNTNTHHRPTFSSWN